jgi:hypothetical protein
MSSQNSCSERPLDELVGESARVLRGSLVETSVAGVRRSTLLIRRTEAQRLPCQPVLRKNPSQVRVEGSIVRLHARSR